MKPVIRKIVEPVHMGLGHDGLSAFLKKNAGVDITKFSDGDLVMCLNRHGDKLKVIGCKGLVVGYLKMPHGMRIMKDALQFIPRTFGSGGFNYDQACKQALEERLKQPNGRMSPLQAAEKAHSYGL